MPARGLKPDAVYTPKSPPAGDRLDKLAWLMDRAVTIPGTNITVGLDALLGLLPVGGDVLTGIIQAALVLVAITHYKVPRAVAARMVANVLLDIGVGAIPFVGDVFDIFFKANTRNMALLREARGHAEIGKPMPSAPSTRYLLGLGALMGVAVAAVLALFIALVVWLLGRPLL